VEYFRLLEFYGILLDYWNILEYFGILWNIMDYYGILWNIFGLLDFSMYQAPPLKGLF
jgi:hypothetical protein